MKVILDIETDGFNPSKIHCIVAKDIDTNTIIIFDPERMYSFKNWKIYYKNRCNTSMTIGNLPRDKPSC